MSATDNLNQVQFYHGSAKRFTGVVKPTSPIASEQSRRGAIKYAFATTDRKQAESYANMESGTGYVYQVQPTGPISRDDTDALDRGDQYKSTSPWKVLGRTRVSSADAYYSRTVSQDYTYSRGDCR